MPRCLATNVQDRPGARSPESKPLPLTDEEKKETRQEPVPLHLRNAPTRLMKDLGYAKGYRYAHDEEDRVADMECLPDSLRGRSYYHPTQEGREKQLAQRMEEIRKSRLRKRTD